VPGPATVRVQLRSTTGKVAVPKDVPATIVK
jgi:hypothetical protein